MDIRIYRFTKIILEVMAWSFLLSNAGVRSIQSGEGAVLVPPQDSCGSPHDVGMLWRCDHNAVTYDIRSAGWRRLHRKEKPLGAAGCTDTGDSSSSSTVTASLVCALAWSWLHQRMRKKTACLGQLCGMMGRKIWENHFSEFAESVKLMDFWKPRFSTETSTFQSWPAFSWVSEAPGIYIYYM